MKQLEWRQKLNWSLLILQNYKNSEVLRLSVLLFQCAFVRLGYSLQETIAFVVDNG